MQYFTYLGCCSFFYELFIKKSSHRNKDVMLLFVTFFMSSFVGDAMAQDNWIKIAPPAQTGLVSSLHLTLHMLGEGTQQRCLPKYAAPRSFLNCLTLKLNSTPLLSLPYLSFPLPVSRRGPTEPPQLPPSRVLRLRLDLRGSRGI